MCNKYDCQIRSHITFFGKQHRHPKDLPLDALTSITLRVIDKAMCRRKKKKETIKANDADDAQRDHQEKLRLVEEWKVELQRRDKTQGLNGSQSTLVSIAMTLKEAERQQKEKEHEKRFQAPEELPRHWYRPDYYEVRLG